MPDAATAISGEAEKAEVTAPAPTVTETVAKLDDKPAADTAKSKDKKEDAEKPKEEEEEKPKDESLVLEQELAEKGWAIAHHPSLPYSYKVTRHGQIYTVVERLGRPRERINIRRSIQKKWLNFKRLAPLFLRFTKETSLPLGKRRIIAYMLGNILLAVLPSWQTKANWQLTDLTRKAIETRVLDKVAIARAAALDIACYLLEKLLKDPIEENKARLQYRFRALVKERILLARIRLDAVTSSDERVKGKIRSARQLLAQQWRTSLLIEHVSNIMSTLSALISQGLVIKNMAGSDNRQVVAASFITNMLLSAERFSRGGFSKYESAITDDRYRRANVMQDLSERAGQQDQLLGLRSYYLEEYRTAIAQIGDASAKEPDVHSGEFQRPFQTVLFDMLRRGNDAFLYILFAAQAIARPARTLGDAAAAMSDLHLIKSATGTFSHDLTELANHFKGILGVMQPIESYYSLDSIKSLLKTRKDPVPYQTFAASPNTPANTQLEVDLRSDDDTLVNDTVPATPAEPVKTGMKIEFRNVSFRYPHAKKPALDNVSFIIEAGELVSIVGFSGSGKSTLIALLTRLHDPDSGEILLNDIPVTWLDPEDLYSRISMLFQVTEKLDLTIREFIKLGDISRATDEDVIAAAKESGAHEIIEKLPKKYDSPLGARHWWGDTVVVSDLVKRAQQMDDWEDRYYGKVHGDDQEEEDKTKDESTDEDSRKILEKANTHPIVSSPELLKWTKKAARYYLPEPHRLETEMLKESYNPDKAEPEGEKGAKFSGGEWAKVVMARTLLRKHVDLVICDEFSAALDPLSESQIFNKLLERQGRVTLLTVTHRFHLACRSDRILFMKEGKLLENGSHAELMALKQEYAKMYDATAAPSSHKKEVSCQVIDGVDIPAEEKKDEADAKEGEEDASKKGKEESEASALGESTVLIQS